jgi:hypothetical protein
LSISSISVTGANAADFAQSNNCGTSLAANASCTINVTLNPSAVGTRTASLTVVDGAATRNIPLTGTAVAQAALLNPANAMVFDAQSVGMVSAIQAVTLTNTGSGPLPVTRVTISTSGESNQFAQTNDCGTTLARGASCTINVTFVPTTAGSKLERLTVKYAGGMQTVTLRGTAAAPASTLTPGMPIVFGNQLIGTGSGAVALTLSNDGVIPLSISGITIGAWGQQGQFAQTNTCGTSLAAGASCTISVSFTPSTAGSKLATLIVSDAAGGHAVALSGTGVTSLTAVTTASPVATSAGPVVSTAPMVAAISVVPLALPASTLNPAMPLAFGTQMIGASSGAQLTTLSNTGVLPLQVTSITISGTNAADFTQTNTCGFLPASLAAGSTCLIDVTFTPTTAGAKNATLTVVDTAGTHTITLSGTGL